MAVLPLASKSLYIVIHEHINVLGKHSFRALPETFEDWIDADRAAQVTAYSIKRRAWVAEIGRPNLIELVAK